MKKAFFFITEYVLLFALASFIGWLYEITCVWVMFRTYYDRGILHIPICPIYGFGILLLLLIFRKVKNPFGLFAGSALVTTSVELLSSYVLEYGFGLILWTYEGWPLSFQNRISAISSLLFGLMAVLFIKLVKPPADKLFSSKYRVYAACAVCAGVVMSVMAELMLRRA
ncbi:MAG: putative ABC transporter permease [Lachnospiraceae bacterium]|nr:putative ABC transporter permease [Lachnospiraceae bacterium]